MSDPMLPNQKVHAEPSMEDYGATLESLKAMSDDELRRFAEKAGVDGVATMERDHLLSKLMDEPGANEL